MVPASITVDRVTQPHRLRALLTGSLMILAVTVTAAPPARADSSTRWGVDSVNPITQAFVNQITTAYGHPDFYGRYLGGTYALTSAEISVATNNSIDLLLVDNRPVHNDRVNSTNAFTTGYFTGEQAADAAADSAAALSVPPGTGLFVDFEASTDMDWLFIEGWYDQVTQRGYVPGFYANTIAANSKFDGAYCTAVNDMAKYGKSYIWSSVRSTGPARLSSLTRRLVVVGARSMRAARSPTDAGPPIVSANRGGMWRGPSDPSAKAAWSALGSADFPCGRSPRLSAPSSCSTSLTSEWPRCV
jgi:hypothetical protein